MAHVPRATPREPPPVAHPPRTTARGLPPDSVARPRGPSRKGKPPGAATAPPTNIHPRAARTPRLPPRAARTAEVPSGGGEVAHRVTPVRPADMDKAAAARNYKEAPIAQVPFSDAMPVRTASRHPTSGPPVPFSDAMPVRTASRHPTAGPFRRTSNVIESPAFPRGGNAGLPIKLKVRGC